MDRFRSHKVSPQWIAWVTFLWEALKLAAVYGLPLRIK